MSMDKLNGNLQQAWSDVLSHYKERFETLAKKYNLKLRCGNGTYLIMNQKETRDEYDISKTNKRFKEDMEKLRKDVQETCDNVWHCIDADMVLSWTDANTWPWKN